MHFLGVDTAHRNLGLAILSAGPRGFAVEKVKTFSPPKSAEGIFAPALFCSREVQSWLDTWSPASACVEGAALSAKFGMVSVGAVHGTIAKVLVDARLPWVYPTPTTAKIFFTGMGDASKADIRAKVRELFGKLKKENAEGKMVVTDENENDAIMLAFLAYWFHTALTVGVEGALAGMPSAILREWTVSAFLRDKPLNQDKKKPGILHRPGEFFWIPHEQKEVFHVPV